MIVIIAENSLFGYDGCDVLLIASEEQARHGKLGP